MLDEAGNGKGRPGEAFSSCHPASPEPAEEGKRLSRQGWETPSAVQGPQSWLEVQSRAYLQGEVLWTSQRPQ